MSLTNGHEDVAIFLLQKESKGGETALISGASSASPIAADGKLYIASEDGKIFVVTGGTGLTPIATNDMNEVVMATPAIRRNALRPDSRTPLRNWTVIGETLVEYVGQGKNEGQTKEK